jgi:hypothetical protein
MKNSGRFSEFLSRLNEKAEKKLKMKGDKIKANSEDKYHLNVMRAELLKGITNQIHEKKIFDLSPIVEKDKTRQKFIRNCLKKQKDLHLKDQKFHFNRKDQNIEVAYKNLERTKNIDSDRQKFIILTMADDFHRSERTCGNTEHGRVQGGEDHSLGGATDRLGDNWFTFEIQITLDPETEAEICDIRHFSLYFYHQYHGPAGLVMPTAMVYPFGYYETSLSNAEAEASPLRALENFFGINHGTIILNVDGWLNIDLENSRGRAFEYSGNPDTWFHREFDDISNEDDFGDDFGGDETILSGPMIPLIKDGDLVIASVNVETDICVKGNDGASGRLYLYVLVPAVSLVVTPL